MKFSVEETMQAWREREADVDDFLAQCEPDWDWWAALEPDFLERQAHNREIDRSWEEACRKANAAYRAPFVAPLGAAPIATLEALVFGLREGLELLNADRLRRLAALSLDQMTQVVRRLQNFQSHIASPWSVEEIDALIELWARHHG